MKVIIILAAAIAFLLCYSEPKPKTDYNVTLINDSIVVSDPDNGNIIFSEHYQSGSKFAEAITKDNK